MPGMFDEESAKRIGKVVRRLEASPLNSLPDVAGARVVQPNWFAYTTSTITSFGGTTLGKGTAKLQLISVDSSGVGTLAPSPQAEITVYHGGPTSIASGKLIQVKMINSRYIVDVVYC